MIAMFKSADLTGSFTGDFPKAKARKLSILRCRVSPEPRVASYFRARVPAYEPPPRTGSCQDEFHQSNLLRRGVAVDFGALIAAGIQIVLLFQFTL
jgi:hypothetical protein